MSDTTSTVNTTTDAGNRLYDTTNVSRGEMTAQTVQDAAAQLQDSFNRIAHTALSKEAK